MRLQGDAGVEGGGVELPVPEQHLDDPDVGVVLQQVRGEAVAQRMHRDALVELGGLCGGVTGAVELARGDRLGGLLAGKEPAARPRHPPPLPQEVEQVGREHREAVLAPLALLDPDQHAGAVDVGDLEVGDLGDAQAAAVSDAEGGTVLQARRVREQERDLLGAEHDRQPLGRGDPGQAVAEPGPAERHMEEEPQGRAGKVHLGRACAERGHVELIAA